MKRAHVSHAGRARERLDDRDVRFDVGDRGDARAERVGPVNRAAAETATDIENVFAANVRGHVIVGHVIEKGLLRMDHRAAEVGDGRARRSGRGAKTGVEVHAWPRPVFLDDARRLVAVVLRDALAFRLGEDRIDVTERRRETREVLETQRIRFFARPRRRSPPRRREAASRCADRWSRVLARRDRRCRARRRRRSRVARGAFRTKAGASMLRIGGRRSLRPRYARAPRSTRACALRAAADRRRARARGSTSSRSSVETPPWSAVEK